MYRESRLEANCSTTPIQPWSAELRIHWACSGCCSGPPVAGSWHDQLVVWPQHPLRPPSGATSAATSFSSMLTLSIAHRPLVSPTVPSYDSYCASACLFGRTRQRGENLEGGISVLACDKVINRATSPSHVGIKANI